MEVLQQLDMNIVTFTHQTYRVLKNAALSNLRTSSGNMLVKLISDILWQMALSYQQN